MKKRFMFASMAFATLVGMTACSKDETVAGGVAPGEEVEILDQVTISIEGTNVGRSVSAGEGSENAVKDVALFVKTASSSDGRDAKYKRIVLEPNQTQVTVKYAEARSAVYVVANGYLGDEGGASPFGTTDPYQTYSEEGASVDFDSKIAGTIEKEYIGTLTKDGDFLMSGSANVISGTNGEKLVVQLKRDVAKVEFNVNSVTGKVHSDTKYYRPLPAGPEGIVVKRATQKVQQFLKSGSAESGYTLDMGNGYVEDYPCKVSDSDKFNSWESIFAKISEINTTKNDGSDGNTSTDYTFAHQWNKGKNDQYFTFEDFYVLPNYTEGKSSSTIVILATKIQESANGTDGWTDSETYNNVRYYKARISSSSGFATEKNKFYQVNATLVGPGSATIEDAIKENTKDDLYISLQVQDWGLVVSDQEIQ